MIHSVLIGLGANLGDRQGTILEALQRLRAHGTIAAVSSFYETAPADGVAGPAFLNAAAELRTELAPQPLWDVCRSIEAGLGRRPGRVLDARPIDIDLLSFDDLDADFGAFALPHPYLARRAYNLIPLAEIAANRIEPRSGRTIGDLAAAADATGVVRKRRSIHFVANRQEELPDVRLSLNRVGVSSVRQPIDIGLGGRRRTVDAEFTMVADLAPDKAGVHMSRFSELLTAATYDVLTASAAPARIEDLSERIAREIVDSQGATRADVRVRAAFPLERWTPVSGRRTEETYAIIGIAHADAERSKRLVGIEAQGMTACPCAQLMVREHSLRELTEAGFSERDAQRALDALPVATHNQRGTGTVLLGSDAALLDVRAEDLVEIVESSMSSETYGLLKRPDEFFVVNKAHHHPRFVEDVVRGILGRVLDVYGDLPDDTFVAATQVNDESIHKHDAFAEAFGTLGEFRRELRDGVHVAEKTDLAAWLGTRQSAVIAI